MRVSTADIVYYCLSCSVLDRMKCQINDWGLDFAVFHFGGTFWLRLGHLQTVWEKFNSLEESIFTGGQDSFDDFLH